MRFSAHAQQQLARRNITREEAESTVARPDVKHTDRAGNPCYIRLVAGRRIRVVVSKTDQDFVITVINLDSDD